MKVVYRTRKIRIRDEATELTIIEQAQVEANEEFFLNIKNVFKLLSPLKLPRTIALASTMRVAYSTSKNRDVATKPTKLEQTN